MSAEIFVLPQKDKSQTPDSFRAQFQFWKKTGAKFVAVSIPTRCGQMIVRRAVEVYTPPPSDTEGVA